MSDDPVYRFERRARRLPSVLSLLALWLGLGAVWIGLDMALWIVLLLAAFTLPALWDVIRDARATLEVRPNRLKWSAAFSAGDSTDIDHIRLNRRFDGSMKITLVHVGGATTRLPPDIAPPMAALENALNAASIPCQRHPFSPF